MTPCLGRKRANRADVFVSHVVLLSERVEVVQSNYTRSECVEASSTLLQAYAHASMLLSPFINISLREISL